MTLAARLLGTALLGGCAQMQPPSFDAALKRARMSPDHVAVWAADADAAAGPVWSHRADALVNPASLMKLVTSTAALDVLGPGYRWTTTVHHGEVDADGVLHGDLVLRGSGDPQFATERLTLLLARVRQEGVREIRGDIVLDRSAFGIVAEDPAAFDEQPLRPYNVQPDALLINFKSVTLTFRPEPARGIALISHLPQLAGLEVPRTVELADGPCGDWRAMLAADLSNPAQVRLAGRYPAACGERTWSYAYPDPDGYAPRAVEAAWHALGGTLAGQVRHGSTPPELPAVHAWTSPTLAEALRSMNKASNNVMAQHLLLTLGLERHGSATWEAGRAVLTEHAAAAGCHADELVVDNGSGRSRTERITARCLGRLLQAAWRRPWMPELLASLPWAGEDTARRARSVAGIAHLKTGSLRDAAGVAGVVHLADGRRRVVVIIVNDPQLDGPGARELLDGVLDSVSRQPAVPAPGPPA